MRYRIAHVGERIEENENQGLNRGCVNHLHHYYYYIIIAENDKEEAIDRFKEGIRNIPFRCSSTRKHRIHHH
jgi:hypothetical protein